MASGEYLSRVTFHCLSDDDRSQLQRHRLQQVVNEFELNPSCISMDGLPTLLSIDSQRATLSEIQLYAANSPKQHKPLKQSPLAKKSERERAFRGMDRKLRELYDSDEFRVMQSLYPQRKEHRLLGQYIQLQHSLAKQLAAQLDRELESQMQVASPDHQEPRRLFGGIDQLADPLYTHPGPVDQEEEEFSFGPGSPRYEPQFEWSGAGSPVYRGFGGEVV
jgi:hypothetical protein